MAHKNERSLVEAALHEVLQWEELRRSPQLGAFLRYVVERTLDGDQASLKAYPIAVDVFGRPPDFDPQSDPIVRVQAARLRKVLNRYYDAGLNNVPMRIDIPVGRYVPSFSTVKSGVRSKLSAPRHLPKSENITSSNVLIEQANSTRWPLSAVVAVMAILVAVVSSMSLLAWLTLGPREDGGKGQIGNVGDVLPPTVNVMRFENLTGLEFLDDAVGGFSLQLVADLSRFELLHVVQGENGVDARLIDTGTGVNAYLLNGVLRRSGDEVYFNILLSHVFDRRIVWTQTLRPNNPNSDWRSNLTALSQKISAELGSLRGPLHFRSRAWLAENPRSHEGKSAYVCQLLGGLARDKATPANRDAALSCFTQLRNAEPVNALAQAGWAGLRVDKLRDTAPLGERLAGKLFDETHAARLAVERAPRSAIVYGELAHVLAVQNLRSEAQRFYKEALQRNPANTDIRAEYALFLAYSGEWEAGLAEINSVLAQATASPPWHYELRAFNAVRTLDYEAALSDALIVLRGDPELGKVLALSTAPAAARSDIVERYLMEVLTDPFFQENGILPRLSRRIGDEEVLQLLVPGLLLAGVPVKAINLAFSPADFTALD